MPVPRKCECPHCRTSVKIRDGSIATVIRCPHCRTPFEIPIGESPPDTSIARSSEATVLFNATSPHESAEPPEVNLGRLGRFELRSVLGQGGFGRVYKAWDPQLERTVALKVPTFTDAGPLGKRFRIEAKSAARLRHPNIVPTFEAGQADGQLFIASQFVDGRPLSSITREGPTEIRLAAAWTGKIARALAYAHELGIVHRDVKPHNIMLDHRGEPQLMDFGLAKAQGDDSAETIDGSLMGTPIYMSPEQARGEISHVGPPSDQYSLGAVFYELLSGRKPFSGAPHLVLVKVQQEDPEPLPRSGLPADLIAICEKAMSKSIAGRYASCLELADDLDRWARGESPLARPAGRLEKAVRWVRRNPRVTAAFSTAFLAMSIAAILGISFASFATRKAAEERKAVDVLRDQQNQTQAALKDAEAARDVANTATARATEAKERAQDQALRLRATTARSAFQNGVSRYEIGETDAALASLMQGAELIEAESPLRRGYHRVLLDRIQRGGSLLAPPIRTAKAIAHASFSPDGRRCVTGDEAGTAQIWDVRSGQPIGKPMPHPSAVTYAGFDPTGAVVLTSCRDGVVRLWNAESATLRRELSHSPRKDAGPLALFSPDGKSLVTTGADSLARIWDTSTFGRIGADLTLSDEATELRFNHSGDRLAIGSRNGAVRIWSATDSTGGSRWSQLCDITPQHGAEVTKIMFSPDDALLLTAARDHHAGLWDPKTGQLIGERVRHDSHVVDAVFSRDGDRFVTTSFDSTARLWNTRDQRPLGEPMRHVGYVLKAAFSPDDRTIATGSQDGILQLWDARDAKSLASPLRHRGAVTALAFDSDSLTLLSASRDRTAMAWSLDAVLPAEEIDGLGIQFAAVDATGDRLLINGFQETRLLGWNGTSAYFEAGLPHLEASRCGCFSHDGQLCAAGTLKGTIFVWRVRTGELLQTLRSDGTVYGLAFSPDDRKLLSGHKTGETRLWDVATGEPAASPTSQGAEVRCIGFHPRGTQFAAGTVDGTIRVWNTASGTPVGDPFQHDDGVAALAFDPTGRWIAGAGFDGTVILWDLATGAADGSSIPHREPVRSVAFSSDGTRFATGGAEGRVQLFDVATRTTLGVPLIHGTDDVMTLAFCHDDRRLVTASLNGRVRVWNVSPPPSRRSRIRTSSRPSAAGRASTGPPTVLIRPVRLPGSPRTPC